LDYLKIKKIFVLSVLVLLLVPPTVPSAFADPPVVTISSPTEGSQHLAGSPVDLTAAANDPEQGVLDPSTFRWTSDVEGFLRNGLGTFTFSTTGMQEIKAEISDEDELPGFDTKNIEILPASAGADLSLTKVVDDSTPNEGDNITFTVTITNSGPSTATNVAVSDTLPAGFTAGSPSQGGFAAGVWSVGTLTNGQSETLTISGPAGSAGNTETNSAQVSASDQPDPDSTPNNNIPAEDDQDSDSATAQAVAEFVIVTVNDMLVFSFGAALLTTLVSPSSATA